MSEFREKRYNYRKTVLIWLLISAFFVPVVTAYADENNPFLSEQAPLLASYGNKNGGGLSSVDYEEVTIELIFAHNVADAALRENNASAISVRTEDGENISAEIGFSDAFGDRCSIYVTMRNLYPSMTYYIYIAPNLAAYNGTTAGIEQSMSFHTKEEVINDGSDQGYDQGETDPGNDTGGEKQGEETADGKIGEDAPDFGDEINEEDMVIITDNGSEATDPEEELKEEEVEEEEDLEEEEAKEEEPDKPDTDSSAAAGTENGENFGLAAGEGASDYPGEDNGTSGQEASDASQMTARAQPESEMQEEAPQPEEEAETEPEQLPEEEQPQPETDREEDGQQIVQDSRRPEEIIAGLLALALLTAAVSDRLRRRRLAE